MMRTSCPNASRPAAHDATFNASSVVLRNALSRFPSHYYAIICIMSPPFNWGCASHFAVGLTRPSRFLHGRVSKLQKCCTVVILYSCFHCHDNKNLATFFFRKQWPGYRSYTSASKAFPLSWVLTHFLSLIPGYATGPYTPNFELFPDGAFLTRLRNFTVHAQQLAGIANCVMSRH